MGLQRRPPADRRPLRRDRGGAGPRLRVRELHHVRPLPRAGGDAAPRRPRATWRAPSTPSPTPRPLRARPRPPRPARPLARRGACREAALRDAPPRDEEADAPRRGLRPRPPGALHDGDRAALLPRALDRRAPRAARRPRRSPSASPSPRRSASRSTTSPRPSASRRTSPTPTTTSCAGPSRSLYAVARAFGASIGFHSGSGKSEGNYRVAGEVTRQGLEIKTSGRYTYEMGVALSRLDRRDATGPSGSTGTPSRASLAVAGAPSRTIPSAGASRGSSSATRWPTKGGARGTPSALAGALRAALAALAPSPDHMFFFEYNFLHVLAAGGSTERLGDHGAAGYAQRARYYGVSDEARLLYAKGVAAYILFLAEATGLADAPRVAAARSRLAALARPRRLRARPRRVTEPGTERRDAMGTNARRRRRPAPSAATGGSSAACSSSPRRSTTSTARSWRSSRSSSTSELGWTNEQFGMVNSAFQGAYAVGLLGVRLVRRPLRRRRSATRSRSSSGASRRSGTPRSARCAASSWRGSPSA